MGQPRPILEDDRPTRQPGALVPESGRGVDGGGGMTSVTGRTGARVLTRTLLALVLFAGPASSEARAAIAFVQNVGTNGNTIPGTSLAVPIHGSNGVAVGDSVIVTFVM